MTLLKDFHYLTLEEIKAIPKREKRALALTLGTRFYDGALATISQRLYVGNKRILARCENIRTDKVPPLRR